MSYSPAEGPAITELGSLFTEKPIYTVDDAKVDRFKGPVPPEAYAEGPMSSGTSADENWRVNKGKCVQVADHTSVEDLELAREMEALGLPISFSTAKEKRNGTTRQKKKGNRSNSVPAGKDTEEIIHGVFHNIEQEDVHFVGESVSFLNTVLSEAVKEQQCDPLTDSIKTICLSGETIPNEGDLIANAEIFEIPIVEDGSSGVGQEVHSFNKQKEEEYSESPSLLCRTTEALMDILIQDYPDNSVVNEFGDWRVFWDSFYSRYYFYNSRTQESTWDPPHGFEHFAFTCTSSDLEAIADKAEENNFPGSACDDIPDPDVDISLDRADTSQEIHVVEYVEHSSQGISSAMDATRNPLDISLDVPSYESLQEILIRNLRESGFDENWSDDQPEAYMTTLVDQQTTISKKKKRTRKLMPDGVTKRDSVDISNYWRQRYSYFSRYDDGIKIDTEGWFSVTAESIARHHASRCGSGTIIDCFTGVGGNAIQFAMRSNHVIAIDIHPPKIDYAQINAGIYGVDDRIDFIKGDFFQMAPCLKGDTVFMAPPWGGPDYTNFGTYDITWLKPRDGRFLFEIGRKIASRVVLHLPRNVNINQLAALSLSVDPPWKLEVERNYLNGRLKAVTAYFSKPGLSFPNLDGS